MYKLFQYLLQRFGGEIKEGEYSRTQIGAMIEAVERNYVQQTVTFAVRAGLASNSQPLLLDLMRETARFNCSLTVWSSEGDPVAPERLRALIRTVGLEKVSGYPRHLNTIIPETLHHRFLYLPCINHLSQVPF